MLGQKYSPVFTKWNFWLMGRLKTGSSFVKEHYPFTGILVLPAFGWNVFLDTEGLAKGDVHATYSKPGGWGLHGMNEGHNLSDGVCVGSDGKKVERVGSNYENFECPAKFRTSQWKQWGLSQNRKTLSLLLWLQCIFDFQCKYRNSRCNYLCSLWANLRVSLDWGQIFIN